MSEPDYNAIEKEMREQPDEYFLERMSDEFLNRKANEVPDLIDTINICLDSYKKENGLSFHSIARFIDILGDLHGWYIQSAKSTERPPLDRPAIINEACRLLKREQYISSSIFYQDIANKCLDSYKTEGSLSFHLTDRFINIFGDLYEKSIKTDKTSLDIQSMTDEAYWSLKKEQFISDTTFHIAIHELED